MDTRRIIIVEGQTPFVQWDEGLRTGTAAQLRDWAQEECKKRKVTPKELTANAFIQIQGTGTRSITNNVDVSDPTKWMIGIHDSEALDGWSDARITQIDGQIPLALLPWIMKFLIQGDWRVTEMSCDVIEPTDSSAVTAEAVPKSSTFRQSSAPSIADPPAKRSSTPARSAASKRAAPKKKAVNTALNLPQPSRKSSRSLPRGGDQKNRR